VRLRHADLPAPCSPCYLPWRVASFAPSPSGTCSTRRTLHRGCSPVQAPGRRPCSSLAASRSFRRPSLCRVRLCAQLPKLHGRLLASWSELPAHAQPACRRRGRPHCQAALSARSRSLARDFLLASVLSRLARLQSPSHRRSVQFLFGYRFRWLSISYSPWSSRRLFLSKIAQLASRRALFTH
jgi:hypothetical protein